MQLSIFSEVFRLSYQNEKPMNLTTVKYIIFTFILSTSFNANACTIFCSAHNGKVLAAGNEDWSDPFTKMWITERTTDSNGIINIGHSDYQVQLAVNEHGLFFDFAAIPHTKDLNQKDKTKHKGNIFIEILSKCSNLEEALVFLNKYEYPSSYNQVLMADAFGNSLIVNRDTIIISKKDYQIATNFNKCDITNGDYDCRRYELIEKELSSTNEISVPLFRKLLSTTHQEGKYPTQYSYVIDLANGVLNMYSFHNYENVLTIDIKKEITKGYRMNDLKEMFPISYEEEYFRENHRDSLVHTIVEVIQKNGVDAGLSIYKKAVKKNKDIASYPFALLSIGGDLVHQTWFEDNKGKVFDYWFHPQNILEWKTVNTNQLKEILKVYDYLEATIPIENPKQFIGTYELKGLLYYLIDEKELSKEYFEKTIVVAPTETSNYQRAKLFLDEYFYQ